MLFEFKLITFYRFYLVLILLIPTMFFLPKFFELRLETTLISNLMNYNCTIYKLEQSHAFTIESSSSRNFVTQDVPEEVEVGTESQGKSNETENACEKILQLINKTSNANIFEENRDKNETTSSSIEHEELILFDGRLNVSYVVVNQTAYISILDTMNTTLLDHTDMRKSSLYYNVYILGLTTTLTQIIPMAILLYFNIKIYYALKTSRIMRRQFLASNKNETR